MPIVQQRMELQAALFAFMCNRKYRRCGHCPLVFVVSDASTNSSNVQRLFPPSVQEELRLESIRWVDNMVE